MAVTSSVRAAAEWEWTKGQGWSQGAGSPQATADAQLRYAVALEKRGEYRDAAKQYFLTVRAFPDTDEAGIALQRLAKCLYETENFYQAFKAIEQVIQSYPKTGRLSDLLGVEYKIGKRLLRGARVSQLEEDPEEAKRQSRSAAAEVFQSILQRDPYGKYAPGALIGLGDAKLLLTKPKEAREHYEQLLREFPKSVLVDRARLGITRAKVMEGKADPTEVEQTVQQARARADNGEEPRYGEEDAALDESLRELEEMEAKKMWDAAEFYKRRGSAESHNAWVFSLKEIARRYPRTSHAARARKELAAVGEEAPRSTNRFMPDLSKIDIVPSFLKREENKPAFVTPQRGSEEVKSDVILGPVPGTLDPTPGASAAGATPTVSTPNAVPSETGSGVGTFTDPESDDFSFSPESTTAPADSAVRQVVPEPSAPAGYAPGLNPTGERRAVAREAESAPISPRAVRPLVEAQPQRTPVRSGTTLSAVQPIQPGRPEVMTISEDSHPSAGSSDSLDVSDSSSSMPSSTNPYSGISTPSDSTPIRQEDTTLMGSTAGVRPAGSQVPSRTRQSVRPRSNAAGVLPKRKASPEAITSFDPEPGAEPSRERPLPAGWELSDDFK